MSVEIIHLDPSEGGPYIWLVRTGEETTYFRGGDALSSRQAALDNILMAYSILQIFVSALAQGVADAERGVVLHTNDGKVRWSIYAHRDLLAECQKEFDSYKSAFESVVRTYTELTMFVAAEARRVLDEPKLKKLKES